MDESVSERVDEYLGAALLGEDPVLSQILRRSLEEGLPPINVSPLQGALLQLLARSIRARRVLEIGTLGGYSTTWLARALPDDGTVVALEVNPHHAEVAAANLETAGVRDRVELVVGPALNSLPKLADEGRQFDLVFIDADKRNNPEYFSWALRLCHPGSLLIVDNVVRNGSVLDGEDEDPDVAGTRRLLEMVGAEARVTATAVQTVGFKGHDGFCIALVR